MNKYDVDDSLDNWQKNAEFWDNSMKDASNPFHLEVVRPKVNALLDIQKDDYILDVACGNGNYSGYLASLGVQVVAFDYSDKLIEFAKGRQKKYLDAIDFHVIDATNKKQLMTLKKRKKYTKAVSNMAIMDITDVTELFPCIYNLLDSNGVFVFATQHPCFVTLTEQYLTAHHYYGVAINNQPVEQCYYHRSLQEIFQLCFQSGFVIDGFYEESFGIKEVPDIIVVRARKIPPKL